MKTVLNFITRKEKGIEEVAIAVEASPYVSVHAGNIGWAYLQQIQPVKAVQYLDKAFNPVRLKVANDFPLLR